MTRLAQRDREHAMAIVRAVMHPEDKGRPDVTTFEVARDVLKAASVCCDVYFYTDGPLPEQAPGEYLRHLADVVRSLHGTGRPRATCSSSQCGEAHPIQPGGLFCLCCRGLGECSEPAHGAGSGEK